MDKDDMELKDSINGQLRKENESSEKYRLRNAFRNFAPGENQEKGFLKPAGKGKKCRIIQTIFHNDKFASRLKFLTRVLSYEMLSL